MKKLKNGEASYEEATKKCNEKMKIDKEILKKIR
jgi:hypothetical protein